MKIDLGNMCNFLPQDRVNEFFKMNPQQLLVSLQQTIENGELKDMVKIKRKELESLEKAIKLIEEEVKKFENWKANQQQIKYLEQKLHWTKYSEYREEYNIIKKKLVDAQKAYDHNIKQRLIEIVRQKDPDTFRAMEWIQNNRQLLKFPDMRCFFTPKEKFIIKISRYTKLPAVSSFLLKFLHNFFSNRSNNNLLSKCVSESELTAQQNLLDENLKSCLVFKDKISDCKLKLENILKELSYLNIQRKNLLSPKTKLKTIEAQIRSKTFDLLEYSSEQLVKSNTDIVEIAQNCFLSCTDIITFINQEFKIKFQKLLDERLLLIFLKQQHHVIENKLEGVNSLLQSQLEHLQSIKQEEIEKKAQTKELLAKVQSMSGMSGKSGNCISRKLNELPHEIEEINAKLAELQVLNNTYVYFDHSIVDKHEEMKKKITSYSDFSAENIEKNLKNIWISRIKQVIQAISDKFTIFFEKMKCQGKIELIEDPEGNYEKYSLSLMVSYHPGEKLVQLKHNRHSGGEKAVAVMIFLMSIQQLSTSPFKMIDEINQGMDPINERIIFEIMVDSISKTKATNQYFFFSPKVLPDLVYGENVTIHTIFNGPEIIKEISIL
ncbi:hypothetical protein MXB_67 [Myxobolus squamalis]|nr:hypothetical protein MXB_67 [Myxobolus squamalis]